MIGDFDDHEDGAELRADVCIVGAGAAGIALARELIGTRLDVLVLEGGGRGPEAASQALYDSEVVGLRHDGVHGGRQRVFGGTTTVWGGEALPLDPIDFEPRPWVAHSGWPLTRAELEPYYRRAERVLRLAAGLPYDEALLRILGATGALALDGALLEHCVSKWSPEPDFAAAYAGELAAASNVRVLCHANAVDLVANEAAAAVERLEVRSLSGRSGSVRAGRYVLCCGGIETARLLLASNRVEPHGLGNRHDLVGRYLQDHTSTRCARIVPGRRRAVQDAFDSWHRRGLKYWPKIKLAPEAQRRHGVMNVVGNVRFELPPRSGIVAAKALVRMLRGRPSPPGGEPPAAVLLGRVLRDGGEVARQAYRYGVEHRSYSARRGAVYLEARCEQEPNPASRVTLSPRQRDALGMPRSRIDWRLTPLSRKTVAAFAETVAAEFERLGLARVEAAPFLRDGDGWEAHFADINHHIGTTRMHPDPRRGVVDPDCRVHGIANLYVAGSAVFPTGGYANPTLTALALGLRLADRLKRELGSLRLGRVVPAAPPREATLAPSEAAFSGTASS